MPTEYDNLPGIDNLWHCSTCTCPSCMAYCKQQEEGINPMNERKLITAEEINNLNLNHNRTIPEPVLVYQAEEDVMPIEKEQRSI